MYARSPRLPVLLVLAALPVLGLGCSGPNCQSTCDRLFQTTECDLESPGVSLTDERNNCLDACEYALSIPGDINDNGYDPNQRTTGSRSVDLKNDEEAAAWMECVDATSCQYLSDGYCAPVSF